MEDFVDQKRQEQAVRTLAQAEAIRAGAEGKHPLVVSLAERNAALSEEIAGTMTVQDEIREETRGMGLDD